MQKQGLHKIQWTDWSSNPVRPKGGGWQCSKVSAGCRSCYAEAMNKRFGNGRPFNDNAIVPFELDERELNTLLRLKGPARVFPGDMTDLWHKDVPDDFLDALFAVAALRPDLTFQTLTKRADRMRAYYTAPDRATRIAQWAGRLAPERTTLVLWPMHNVWQGVSVESARCLDRARDLVETPAYTRWISYEPALGPLGLEAFEPLLFNHRHGHPCPIHWVVAGGESGTDARPFHVEWAHEVIDAGRRFEFSVFVKQLGCCPRENGKEPSWLPARRFRGWKGGEPSDWPVRLRVRQMPHTLPAPAEVVETAEYRS